MHAPSRLLVVLTAGLLMGGPLMPPSGSLTAAEPPSATIDLVELAVTLPEVVNRVRLLEIEARESQRLVERGATSSVDARRIRMERDATQQKLELLQMIIQSELTVCRSRIKAVKSDVRGPEADLDIQAAQLREELLVRMERIADLQAPAAQDEATSQTRGKTAADEERSETRGTSEEDGC